MPSSPSAVIRRLLLVIVALGIGALILLRPRDRERQLPVLGSVPQFFLTAEDGRAVTRNDLADKLVVADFIFTHCAGTCPIMTESMVRLQSELAGYPDVHLVSFSVDPERDTPDVLKKYARAHGAIPGKWTFLTGEKKAIYELTRKGFRLGLAEEGGSPEEPILHSSKFVLVDRRVQIRGYYDGTEDAGLRKLIHDVRILREEHP